MILPIVAYGDPVLRKKATAISEDYPKLDTLIENMFDTMYPCIISPALGVNRVIPEPSVADSVGFQPAYGYARDQPGGIASIKKRDALFAYTCPPIMSTQTQLAPMMNIKPF